MTPPRLTIDAVVNLLQSQFTRFQFKIRTASRDSFRQDAKDAKIAKE
jgi:hypothetical protein